MTHVGRKFETHNGLRYSPAFPRTVKGVVTGFCRTGPGIERFNTARASIRSRFFYVHLGCLWCYPTEKDNRVDYCTELRDGTVSFEYAARRISWEPADFDENYQQGVVAGWEVRHHGQTFKPRQRYGFSFVTRNRLEFDTWLECITQCSHWALEQVYRPLYTIRENGEVLKEQIGIIAAHPGQRDALVLIRKYGNVDKKDKLRIFHDVSTAGHIEHNHVLRHVDCLLDREQVVTVHEVVRDSLKSILEHHGKVSEMHNQPTGLPENVVRRICFEIVQGLIHLHTRRNTLHGDLTVDNIRFAGKMYTGKKTAVKISGFHYACEFSKLSTAHEFNPISKYCWPPEMMRKEKCTAKADIWMLGCIVFEALSGERAERFYEARERPERYFEVGGGGGNYPDFTKLFAKDTWDGLSENCRDFLRKTLAYNPADRPRTMQLETHLWIFDFLPELKPSRHSVVTKMTQPIVNKSNPTKATFPNRLKAAFGRSRQR